jgi:hypothetical protein
MLLGFRLSEVVILKMKWINFILFEEMIFVG